MKEQLTFKAMILNELDNGTKGLTADELAQTSGTYSSGSNLRKVLRDEKKEFDKFQGLVRIINQIWENESEQMMVKFSEEIDPNKKTARNLLEYLAMSREFEAFNNLIDKMVNCTNKESIEWSKVYKMQYKYEIANTQGDYELLIKELSEIKTNFIEMKVYKNILLNHCLNQLSDFGAVNIVSKEIDYDINLIDNEYIKMSYSIRSNQIKSFNSLIIYNNPEEARKSSDDIIASEAKPSFKAYAYFLKGYSYLFTSYENTVKYLNKGIEIYNSINRKNDAKDLEEKIEFAGVFWEKIKGNEIKVIKNKLVYDIKQGVDITNSLEQYKDDIDQEFFLYLQGCNMKNEKKLILSLIKYIKKNDLFLANLPKLELFKNGYDEEILEELTGIKMA
jgi:hypothetical protein